MPKWLVLLFIAAAAGPRKTAPVTPATPPSGFYTVEALRQLARDAGFTPDAANVAAAVAMAESGGNPNAVGDQGTSFGLWQFHMPAHPGQPVSRAMSPSSAAAWAFELSKGGTDWSPWTTFTTGAYRRYMP
jgi:hypothetical protein